LVYSCLLKNELLGANIDDIKSQCDERRPMVPLEGMNLFQVQQLYLRYQTTATTTTVITRK
jgi:cell division cycle 20-like protein 1 (cofactor of APC complex)